MSIRRYLGFSMVPALVPGGASRPVSIASDDDSLTLWIGEPATVFQTPWSEVRNIQVIVGRQLVIEATIADTRYRWRVRRRVEHDELVESLRAHGAHVGRATRRRVPLVMMVALVVLVASAASLSALVSTSTHPARETTADVADINVQQSDLPAGWRADSSALLTVLVGTRGELVTPKTHLPALTGAAAATWHDVTHNFQTCMGVPATADRMFGAAGQFPSIQVTGASWASSANGGTEIASLAQYYSSTTMVTKDLAEYSSAPFGACWARSGAQELVSTISGSVSSANDHFAVTPFTPVTFAHGFRRGGLVTLSLPGVKGTSTLVSIYGASGHVEVNFYALVANWSTARPVVLAAFEAMMARVSTHGTVGAT
jgi:hypothetical protein